MLQQPLLPLWFALQPVRIVVMRGAVWLLFVYSRRLGYGMQLEALAEQLVMWTVQSQLANAQVPL